MLLYFAVLWQCECGRYLSLIIIVRFRYWLIFLAATLRWVCSPVVVNPFLHNSSVYSSVDNQRNTAV